MNLVCKLVKLFNMNGSGKMEIIVGTLVSGEIFTDSDYMQEVSNQSESIRMK